MSYAYKRSVTVDYTKVPNEDHTDFPVLILGTYAYLATVANGGKVTSASGYDIIFTSDETGLTQLDHEIEAYDAATGAIVFWVRIPTLSHTADTVIWMWYGNSAVVTSQEDVAGTWTAYDFVAHLKESINPYHDSARGLDSSSGTNPTQEDSVIGKGQSFDGSDDYIGFDPNAGYPPYEEVPPYTLGTLSCWIKTTEEARKGIFGRWASDGVADGNQLWQLVLNADGTCGIVTNAGGGTDHELDSTIAVNDGEWHHIVGTASGVVRYLTIYIDATQRGYVDLGFGTGQRQDVMDRLLVGATALAAGNYRMTGSLDEVRVNPNPVSADWVTAEFNNQNDPATFYEIGDEIAVGLPSGWWPFFLRYLSNY